MRRKWKELEFRLIFVFKYSVEFFLLVDHLGLYELSKFGNSSSSEYPHSITRERTYYLTRYLGR